MSNPDLRRYEKELQASVKGFRLRRRLRHSFRQATLPLLEETPSPSYEELTAAFGPPDQMAQDLLRNMANPPQPLRRGQKAGIALAACLVVVGIGVGAFFWWNAPEDEVTLSNGSSYTDDILLSNFSFKIDETFTNWEIPWQQSPDCPTYLLLLHNTHTAVTTVTVQYAALHPPHTIEVPPRSTRAFLVEDAQPGEHILSFSSSDGSLSGTFQVLVALPSNL
ncbi:MAG TPA: DUF4448 domain-containing protein [Candidatus Evtepia faecavium]|nr:DUF4448 domain-containing protein [Candidatus Evtepia faecavium]